MASRFLSEQARLLENFHLEHSPPGSSGSGGLFDHHSQLPRVRSYRGSGAIGGGGGGVGCTGGNQSNRVTRGGHTRRRSSNLGSSPRSSVVPVGAHEDRGRSTQKAGGSGDLSQVWGKYLSMSKSRGNGGGVRDKGSRDEGGGDRDRDAAARRPEESPHEKLERQLMVRGDA